MVKNNRKIYIKVTNGLCNRLRTLNSFANFADKTNSELFVCWEESSGFGDEKFNDLFENKINLVTLKEYEFFSKNVLNLEKAIVKQNKDPGLYDIKENKDKLIEIVSEDDFCYHGDSCIEWLLSENFFNYESYDFLKSLVVSKDLMKIVEDFCFDWPIDIVGVHIRRGDSWTSPWSSFYKKSSDGAFIKLMTKQISGNPDIKFFLATDCEKTQNLFLEKFSKSIIFRKKDFFLSSCYKDKKFNQKDALIDLILLSKTKKIIGSNWSSFSFMATKFSDIDLDIAME
jgi:hypothetical protein